MNKKSILAIEKIITCITELKIITTGNDFISLDNEYEMPIICGLVDDIDSNICKIDFKIKNKYSNINWNVINLKKEDDGDFKVLKLGKIWELANGILEKELYKQLNNILELELPIYYKNYCNKKHKQAVKQAIKERNELKNEK